MLYTGKRRKSKCSCLSKKVSATPHHIKEVTGHTTTTTRATHLMGGRDDFYMANGRDLLFYTKRASAKESGL